jgi:hypothetical protein
LLRSPELHGLTLQRCQTGKDNLKSIKGSPPPGPARSRDRVNQTTALANQTTGRRSNRCAQENLK